MTTISKGLTLPLDDDLELAKRVEKGVPALAISALAQLLGFGSIARTAELVNMSAKTAERRIKTAKLLLPDESERVVRLIRIFKRAENVFEDSENARRWMEKPLKMLGNKSPLVVSTTEPGARAVEQALGRLEQGIVG